VARQRERAATPEQQSLLELPEMETDTELRLQYLAEAAEFDLPELFARQVEWTSVSHRARGVAPDLLLANLTCLGEVLCEELPASAYRELQPYLELARARASAVSRAGSPDSSEEPSGAVRELLVALLEGRREEALSMALRAVDQGHSVQDVAEGLLVPAEQELGRLWQAGEIHSGEEHLASRIVEDALSQLRPLRRRSAERGTSVLCTGIQGDLHQMGSRLIADRLQEDGWRALWLGSNLPTRDLLRSIDDLAVDLVALSVSMSLQAHHAAELIEALGNRPGPRIPVLVGGRAFDQVPGLWQAVGAQAYAATPDQAAREAARLVPR
jgi:methanogenic corrinoid protein MtbC1